MRADKSMNKSEAPIALPLFLPWLQSLEFPRKLGVCERLFSRSLAPRAVCWVRTSTGLDWKLDMRNSTHRWIVYGLYEGGSFLRWARRNLPQNATVVDSGANIGQMALYLGTYFPGGKILAFEPGIRAAEWLASCLSRNPGLPVELIRAGLSDQTRSGRLRYGDAELTHGSQAEISDHEGAPIELVRLDEFLAQRRVMSLDCWKLDVEGHEIAALQGANTLFKERKIKALYIELCGENGTRICRFMEAVGYRAYNLSRNGGLLPLEKSPEHGNALFLPA